MKKTLEGTEALIGRDMRAGDAGFFRSLRDLLEDYSGLSWRVEPDTVADEFCLVFGVGHHGLTVNVHRDKSLGQNLVVSVLWEDAHAHLSRFHWGTVDVWVPPDRPTQTTPVQEGHLSHLLENVDTGLSALAWMMLGRERTQDQRAGEVLDLMERGHSMAWLHPLRARMIVDGDIGAMIES